LLISIDQPAQLLPNQLQTGHLGAEQNFEIFVNAMKKRFTRALSFPLTFLKNVVGIRENKKPAIHLHRATVHEAKLRKAGSHG
jgi:hypothetical protein